MSEDKGKSGTSKKSMVAPGGGQPKGRKPDNNTQSAGPAKPARPAASGAATGGGASGSGSGSSGTGSRSSGGKGLGVVALVLALVAVAGIAYLWSEVVGGRTGTSTRLAAAVSQSEANTTQLTELSSNHTALRGELETLKASVDEDLAEYAETQKDTAQAAHSVLDKEVDSRLAALKEEIAAEVSKQMGDQQKAQQSTQAGLDDIAKEAREGLEDQGKALQSSLDATQNQLAMLRNELVASEQKLDKSVSDKADHIQSQLDTIVLAQRGLNRSLDLVKETVASGGDKNAWTLSEVAYLLQMADYRLRYQEDVDGALSALTLAQERLKTVDELAFAPVASAIGEQISALRGVRLIDRTAMAQQLAGLAKEAATLPIRNEARTAVLKEREAQKRAGMKADVDMEKPDWWYDAADSAWKELKQLVVVRHERRSMPPLMAPEEEFFLTQNLVLKIEAARLAVLREDGAIFQDSLSMALDWLDSYFETADENVAALVDDLRNLQQVELHPYIPDVSRVSRAFKEVMETRQPLKTMPDPAPEQDSAEGADQGGAA